jgi:hypothetical protein
LSSPIPKLRIRSRTFDQSLRLAVSNAIRSSISDILTYFGENGKMAEGMRLHWGQRSSNVLCNKELSASLRESRISCTGTCFV